MKFPLTLMESSNPGYPHARLENSRFYRTIDVVTLVQAKCMLRIGENGENFDPKMSYVSVFGIPKLRKDSPSRGKRLCATPLPVYTCSQLLNLSNNRQKLWPAREKKSKQIWWKGYSGEIGRIVPMSLKMFGWFRLLLALMKVLSYIQIVQCSVPEHHRQDNIVAHVDYPFILC